MKQWGSYLVSNAISGLLVLVPLAILFLAVIQIWELLEEMAAFAELDLPFPPVVNALIYLALILAAIFLICLLVGLLLKTGPGQRVGEFIDRVITEKVPLLGLVRKLTLSLTGSAGATLDPVEVDVHGSGAYMWGFLMDELPDGRHVVYVPVAPALTLGHTYMVEAERVRQIDGSVADVVNSLTQWGAGARDIYRHSSTSKRQ